MVNHEEVGEEEEQELIHELFDTAFLFFNLWSFVVLESILSCDSKLDWFVYRSILAH